jgi:4a-hydroxytetrahydrobiopterin dehydratase
MVAAMAELITPKQFHDAAGVDDWRVLWSVAFAVFRTGDFAKGLKLVDEIGRVADAAGHHPDLNLRSGVLEVRLVTKEHWSLTDLDLSLARQISAAQGARRQRRSRPHPDLGVRPRRPRRRQGTDLLVRGAEL